MFSLFATPTLSQKFNIASGGTPLLLKPDIVGILGSSQPETTPKLTTSANFLLLIIV